MSIFLDSVSRRQEALSSPSLSMLLLVPPYSRIQSSTALLLVMYLPQLKGDDTRWVNIDHCCLQ